MCKKKIVTHLNIGDGLMHLVVGYKNWMNDQALIDIQMNWFFAKRIKKKSMITLAYLAGVCWSETLTKVYWKVKFQKSSK